MVDIHVPEEDLARGRSLLEAFWTERFFTDPYVRHDTAFPGATAFVQRLHEALPVR